MGDSVPVGSGNAPRQASEVACDVPVAQPFWEDAYNELGPSSDLPFTVDHNRTDGWRMVKTRQYILDEIRRTASENGGTPLGAKTFERETSIRRHEWGRFWSKFGDAQQEAGYSANTRTGPIPDEIILRHAAFLTRELGRRPTSGDIRVKKQADPQFPSVETFLRFCGSFDGLTHRLANFCANDPTLQDVAEILASSVRSETKIENGSEDQLRLNGFVYLIKYGRHYKIGRTNSTGRRERELAIQMPEKPRLVHAIKTDDPEGIEHYWHRRFADRRVNGEWFALTVDDVSAFRWRKFM